MLYRKSSFIVCGIVTTLICGLSGLGLQGATLRVLNNYSGESPRVIAYNMAHFYPGSNLTGWWKYSGVSGARIFLSASHFEVSATDRPGDQTVVDQASFLARRDALRADPLNTDIINWEAIGERFNRVLNSNNKIVPQYALQELHSLDLDILAQMTVSEGSFPIESDNDWQGKWILWRTYYAAAFWLARDFDVERFSSHNEPNHSASLIEPDKWLMRARLASDAAQEALAAVNQLYGKSLQLKFTAPVSAGSGNSVFEAYGKPAIEGIRTDFRGVSDPDYRLLHTYAYQQYNFSPEQHASRFEEVRASANAALPTGVDPLSFAITEFNVHMNATYDSMVESSDSLSKAVDFGGIVTELAKSGMDELYAFKFAMTAANGTFPVAKNGMGFIDSDLPPYNFGGFSRSGEVYRLFNKAVRPGRPILQIQASDTPNAFYHIATRDLQSEKIYIFLTNNTGSSVPVNIDLSALNIPDGNPVLIEDVSEWRKGITRSRETIAGGQLSAGSQPGQSVWLVSIPTRPVIATASDSSSRTVAVAEDAMVKDGIHSSTNYGHEPVAFTRNDPNSRNERAAVFLKFAPIARSSATTLERALLAIPLGSVNQIDRVQANLYGLRDNTWSEDTLTWQNAPNLKQGIVAGNRISNLVTEGVGIDADVLAQVNTGTSPVVRYIDVTDYLKDIGTEAASFLLIQEPRWSIDIEVDTLPQSWDDLTSGDTQPTGMLYFPKESDEPIEKAKLILYESTAPIAYEAWSEAEIADPLKRDPLAAPAGDKIPNIVKFALGISPDQSHENPLQFNPNKQGTPSIGFGIAPQADGVNTRLQTSSDLVLWQPVIPSSVSFDGSRLNYSHNVDLGQTTFFRLEINTTDP